MPVQLPTIFYDIARQPPVAVGLPLAFSAVSGLVTKNSIETWYSTLKRPRFSPPNWLFGPAWTFLYLSMGLASHLIVKKYDAALSGSSLQHAADKALKLYYLQYALNQAWSPLFFGAKQTGLALIEIGCMTVAAFACTKEAYKVDFRTLYLLAPYCAWLSFATYLNGSFWYLNTYSVRGKRTD